jgi:hypothetical protein
MSIALTKPKKPVKWLALGNHWAGQPQGIAPIDVNLNFMLKEGQLG